MRNHVENNLFQVVFFCDISFCRALNFSAISGQVFQAADVEKNTLFHTQLIIQHQRHKYRIDAIVKIIA